MLGVSLLVNLQIALLLCLRYTSSMEPNRGNQDINYTDSPPVVQAPVGVPSTPQQAVRPQPQSPSSSQSDVLVQWNASEFIDHQKSAIWVLPVTFISLLIAATIYLLTKNIFSSVVVILAGISFSVLAYQKPRTMSYSLFPSTIRIGQKTYSYDDFRTFSIMREGALYSVFLEPIKRFMPPITIYFAVEDGEKIFDTLAEHIPHQEKAPDAIDRLMQRIRF